MIYTPTNNPKENTIVISLAFLLGAVGGIFINELFMFSALFFWLLYTIVLIYLQFKKGKKRKIHSVAAFLLHPYVRLFTFIALSLEGIYAAVIGKIWVPVLVLLIWWFFSLNFYFYYKNNPKELKKTT